MSSSTVEKVKEKLGIVDVIGSYITLEKAGTNYKAKCPFHNEKSPSFFISPERNNYYCFGCAAKGDIFTFVQEFEGLDFMGALKILADRAGVPLERDNPTFRTEREKQYIAMEYATLFFQRQLGAKSDARDYLKKRGIVEKTAKEWRLGYAPVEWKSLYTYLKTKGFKAEDIEKVGLIKASEKVHGDYYDRFRGRIMFPIFDPSGRVIAFSGRQFEPDGTQAKYINSPETALFEKSKVLYGYDKAKLEIRKQDFSLLVEGQMDLLMSHQIGLTNAVASSGTALTHEQLEILRRLSNKVVIAYDGDKAGVSAASRGWQLALNLGMDVKIAQFPDGKDPADLAIESPEILKASIAGARHIIDVELDHIIRNEKDTREKVLKIEKNIVPYLSEIQSEIEKSHFISKISHEAQIKEDVLWQVVRKREMLTRPATSTYRQPEAQKPAVPRRGSIERMLFGILFWQEKQASSVIPILDIKKKLSTIIGKDELKELEAEMTKNKDELAFEAEISYSNSNNVPQYVEELVLNLKEDYVRELFAKTMAEMHKAEQEGNSEKVLELLIKCQELSLEQRKIAEERSHF
ncbi:MAG: DNA primase [bacterium]|nr:DNA primase [bacterium]